VIFTGTPHTPDIADRPDRDKALAKAKLACADCPVVTGCLKWALANPTLAPNGVRAATTARQRTALRNDLVARLGTDWVAVVAEQDRKRQQQRRAARVVPPTVREQALARLEVELIPTRPEPYEPWREPITPERATHNRRLLELALTSKAA
jgi:WhiB family redox-sensing transcriptional regulator